MKIQEKETGAEPRGSGWM